MKLMKNEKIVIGVTGPDGGGKDFLQEKAKENFNFHIPSIFMTTNRPPRDPKVENKTCLNSNEFKQMLEANELIGVHENNGYQYGYSLGDIVAAFGNGEKFAFMELNAAKQAHILKEFPPEINMVAWIGLLGEEEYLIHNMTNRGPLSKERLAKKVRMGHEIMDAIKRLKEDEPEKMITFNIGWHNRDTMGEKFTRVVKKLVGEEE